MPADDQVPAQDLELHWELPSGWTQTRSVAQASVTAEGPRALARRPRLTAALERMEPDSPLLGWWAGLDEVLPAALDNYLLIDTDAAAVAGHPGYRRLVHYSGVGGAPTLLEQWAAQQDGLRIVVMATLAPRSYDGLCDALSATVAGARIEPREAGG